MNNANYPVILTLNSEHQFGGAMCNLVLAELADAFLIKFS